MLFRVPALFFFLCCCDNLYGAPFQPDSLKAEAHFENGKFDSALYFFQRWESNTQRVSSLAYCETSIAHVYQLLGNQTDCEKYLLKASSRFDHVSNPASLRSKVHEIRGRNFDYNSRDFQKAREEYTRALRYSVESAQSTRSAAIIHFLIGRTFLFTGDFREAESRFNQALGILEKHGPQATTDLFEVYNGLATLNRRMLKMDEALTFYRKADSIWLTGKKSRMHPNYGLLLYGMGNLFLETGAYHDAIDYYSRALMVFRETYGEKNMRTAVTYMNIGAAKGNQLDFYGAIEYYTKALDSYQKILAPDHPFISSAYIDFCDSYEKMGKYEEALASGRKAIEILERRYGDEENRELGIALYNTAEVLLNMQRGSEALPLINRAISIFRRSDEKYLLNIVLTIKGQALKSLERYPEAETCFANAAAIFPAEAVHNLHLAQTFTSHAALKSAMGHHEKALDLCSRALKQLGVYTSGPYDVFPVRTSFSIDFISSLLAVRAHALWNLYQENGDHSVLMSALENYDLLAEAFERVIMESKAERSKLNQTARVASACEKAIACALEMYTLTGNEEFKVRALGFSERSRAIILSQFVHDSRAREFAGIPDDLLSRERRLKEKITFREKELADLAGQGDVDDSARIVVHHELISTRMRYDSLLRTLKKDYPSYHALRYQSGRADLREIRQQMGTDDGIVEYMLGDSTLYVFVLTRSSIDVIPLHNVPRVNQNVRNVLSNIVEKDLAGFYEYSSLLYRDVFAAADVLLQKHRIKNLLIVPDGSLSYIPFECLLSENVVAQPSYLLQRYSIRYGLTAANATARHEKKILSNGTSIGFAPAFANKLSNFDGTISELDELPYSKTEVDNLAGLYNGVAMYGQDANETSFRRMASDYSIIHLATHAIADDARPDESRLYLANDADTLHDGLLHAYELLNMSLSSQLVTLSACNTGAGSLHRGEGVMSLTRAFAFAGCPSVMTSLWQAQDLSTSRIMESFYKNLAAGLSKSDALRQAKLTYLSESDKVKSLPFFWAGLVVIGADDPIPAEDHFSPWKVWTAGFLLMAGLLFVGIKTRAFSRIVTAR